MPPSPYDFRQNKKNNKKVGNIFISFVFSNLKIRIINIGRMPKVPI